MLITQTTLRPGQKGTKKLVGKYGDRLICVRHRYDPATGRRCTTVELIEEEIQAQSQDQQAASAPAQPHSNVLAIRVEYWESDLRAKVKAAGGIWRPRHKLWELRYDDVVALGLESRVVASDASETESAEGRYPHLGT
jgi:hypothetical protein